MKIKASALLSFTTEQLWNTLAGNFTLVFDDGQEVATNDKETVYSSYFWEMHRETNAKLYADHHVSSVLKGGRLQSSTHLRLLGRITKSIFEQTSGRFATEEEKRRYLYDYIARMGYEMTNNLYNAMVHRLEEYVGSLDITDFHEVLNHPIIKEAYEELQPTVSSIDNTYKAITSTLRDKHLLGHNPLSQLTRAGLVNDKQLQQCLGPRGFITDIDSIQFKTPVLRGYTEGIRRFYDSAIESRSAAKSLIFSKAPLQDTEYFSRRLQLISMALENLHMGDCGSTRYLRWKVQGKEVVGGEVVYQGDLGLLLGKYFLDEKTGSLRQIEESDTHLIGKTIQMRSVIHCRHPDPSGVCSVCFGGLSMAVPENSNLGHMCSTFVTQQSSQAVLSVKHLDGSTVIEGITLSDGEKQFVKVSADGNSYLLADGLKNKKVSVVIPPGKADEKPVNITDVYEVDDVKSLIISRVSEISAIQVVVSDGVRVFEDTIKTMVDRRMASMTHDLLQQIKDKGVTVDDHGNYVIAMDGFDWTKPILSLPLKHFNMSDHSKDIATLLEGTVKQIMDRDRSVYPESMLGDLFILVNRRLAVNLAPLEVVLYTAMVVSAANFDYSLPKPWTSSGVGVMKKTMAFRSLSAAMAFQEHKDTLYSPESYVLSNRPEHVLDAILMPREVIAANIRQR